MTSDKYRQTNLDVLNYFFYLNDFHILNNLFNLLNIHNIDI